MSKIKDKLWSFGVMLSADWEGENSSEGGAIADYLANKGADASAKAKNCPHCDLHFGADPDQMLPNASHDC